MTSMGNRNRVARILAQRFTHFAANALPNQKRLFLRFIDWAVNRGATFSCHFLKVALICNFVFWSNIG